MASKYSVSLKKLLKDFNTLETLYLPDDPENIFITSPDISRPGLVFAGYTNYFDSSRVNYLGKAEVEYLNSLSAEERLT